MAKVYYIPQWDTFENAQSKRIVHRMTWVAFPTRHDGTGFRRVAQHRRGCEILGAWMLIVQTAAKCLVRGVLANAVGPLGPEDLALATGIPAKSFALAFEVLVDEKIQWLAVREFTVDDARSTLGEQSTTLRASRATDRPTEPTDITIPTEPTGDVSGASAQKERGGRTGKGEFTRGFLASLCHEFGWSPGRAKRQERPVRAVANRIWPLEPGTRQRIVDWIIDMAREKADPKMKLKTPEAAWQKEVDKKLKSMGLTKRVAAALGAEQGEKEIK